MAGLELLDGTLATIDMSIAYSGTVQTSLKCSFGYMSADIRRSFTEKTTFCTNGWVERQPGMKQLTGRLDGFASKGTAYSDPLALFANNTKKAFIFTADTSCTLTGFLHAAADHIGLRAAANSERSIDWESAGEVVSAWVVA